MLFSKQISIGGGFNKMAGLVGLNISVGLVNTTQSDIQGALDTIEKNLSPIKVGLEIDDQALQGLDGKIDKINSSLSKQTGGKKSAGSTSGINSTTKALGAQEAKLEDLEKVYNKVQGSTRTFNEEGQMISQTLARMSEDGNRLSVQMDGVGKVLGSKEMFPTAQLRKQAESMERNISKVKELSNFDLSRFRQQMQGAIPKSVDKQLTSISNSINGVSGTSDDALHKIRGFRTELNNVMTQTKDGQGLMNVANQMDRIRQSASTDIALFKDKNKDFLTNDDITKLDSFQKGMEGIRGSSKSSKDALDALNFSLKDSLKTMGGRVTTMKQEESASHTLGRAQKQALHNVEMLNERLSGKIPERYQRQIHSLSTELQNLTPTTKNAVARSRELTQQLSHVSAQATQADRNMAMFKDQMHSAFLRVPIYAATMAMLFTPLKAVQDAMRQMIEIDTQMTVLERVSNGAIEMNDALESSITIAERLGNTIGEVNDGLIDFARQGFRGGELESMTEAATLFSNISEMGVGEASSGLTSIVNGFQMLPDEIMTAVDAINEVDNNFAISSQNIVQSMQKSVGSAKTFGVEMEDLIGMTVAIGETTRESGNIIGNSLKTIFSRITTMDESIAALEGVGVSVEDMNGSLRPVSGILDDLGHRWSTLNAEQQQHIGLQIAG